MMSDLDKLKSILGSNFDKMCYELACLFEKGMDMEGVALTEVRAVLGAYAKMYFIALFGASVRGVTDEKAIRKVFIEITSNIYTDLMSGVKMRKDN